MARYHRILFLIVIYYIISALLILFVDRRVCACLELLRVLNCVTPVKSPTLAQDAKLKPSATLKTGHSRGCENIRCHVYENSFFRG